MMALGGETRDRGSAEAYSTNRGSTSALQLSEGDTLLVLSARQAGIMRKDSSKCSKCTFALRTRTNMMKHEICDDK